MGKKKGKKAESAKTRAERVRRSIERSNRRFAMMTPREKKVQIAKDVLMQLDAGLLDARSGTYFASLKASRLLSKLLDKNDDVDVELKEVLDKTPQCEVCAIGAAFVCAVKREGSLLVTNLVECRDLMVEYLTEKEIFSDDELTLMEVAFEGAVLREGYEGLDPLNKALYFNHNIPGEKERLRRVMKAVIGNPEEGITCETFGGYKDKYTASN